jgi:hypothetical protein
VLKPAGALFWGTVKSIHDSRIVLVLRTGELLQVDLSEAFAGGTTIVPLIGENVIVNGKHNEQGVLEARVMWRAKAPQSWGADSEAEASQERDCATLYARRTFGPTTLA